MIRQPVSRITFDRRRGFLGVHLQEGAPFLDAAWNEGADIAWALLRDAIRAGGLEGTAGRELRIEPMTDKSGRLRNLRVCSTSPDPTAEVRPFYCNGLPVLWLADLPIDAQPIGDAFRADATGDSHVPSHGTWIDLLQATEPYDIVLRARVVTLDRLDDPYLDDPGLDTPRGTFRKRVVGEVRVRKTTAPQLAVSNVQLSIDGTYRSDLNALYRVELDAATGTRAAPAASVLWDPDAAATVARIIDNAVAGDRRVDVDTTDGFDAGFVRFEGPGVGPELYRVTRMPGAETAAIQVTRHRCDRDERSLAAWQLVGQRTDADPDPRPDHFVASFLVPAPVQVGDLLRDLPPPLCLDHHADAIVVAVTGFDAPRNAVTLTLRTTSAADATARALSVADWHADGEAVAAADKTYTATLVAPPAIAAGDIVVALPPSLGSLTGPWIVLKVEPRFPNVTVTFGPAGLAQDLHRLDTDRKATLRAQARQFETTLIVDAREDWTVGMRVTIAGKPPRTPASVAPVLTTAEERTIVRIERVSSLAARDRQVLSRHADPARLMMVRLDLPLSSDHTADDEDVTPERVIRVRRFAGHTCRLPIDTVDPARDGAASIASFASGQALAEGLALHLTVEHAEARVVRGDGWHFAARGDGWYETRLFAPVEEAAASEVPLARLVTGGSGRELLDLRPLPAALAVDDELARIAEAACTIASLLGDDPALPLLSDIAELAGTRRVQPVLLRKLHELSQVPYSKLSAGAIRRGWLERLDQAVAAATDTTSYDSRTRRQIASIAFAIGGLAYAFAAEPSTRHRPPSAPPSAPASGPPSATPTVATPASPTTPPANRPTGPRKP